MAKLSIKQYTLRKNQYKVELSLEEENQGNISVTAKFKFELSEGFTLVFVCCR